MRIILAFLFISSNVFAQTIIKKDPKIEHIVNEVSAEKLQETINKLVSFKTRSTLSSTTNATEGIGAARQWAFNEFKSLENANFKAELHEFILEPDGRRIDKPIKMANVIGKLQGTDDRIFMVSGHIDSRATNVMDSTSIAPGANDDGSGTALVMELARVMSKQKFNASVWFVIFSGEEQGLLGAKELSKQMKADSLNLVALLNNDIIGSSQSSETNIIDNTKIRVFSTGLPYANAEEKLSAIRSLGFENDGDSRQLARYIKEVGQRYVDHMEVKLIYRNDRFLRGGDHTSFVKDGFTAVRLSEMNEDYTAQHQDIRNENGIDYGDTPEKMDFEYLKKNTQINAANLANLASAPAQPKDVFIEAFGLGNTTRLNWSAVENATAYYVLMRETHMPFWQKKLYTQNTKIELPYSKDNYFFAIQSVDAQGHESLMKVPRISFKKP